MSKNYTYNSNFHLLDDGRVCSYQTDMVGGRQYTTLDETTYGQQVLLFRYNNPLSNIGIKAVAMATAMDWLLFRQRMWDKRYFEQTGKIYQPKEG